MSTKNSQGFSGKNKLKYSKTLKYWVDVQQGKSYIPHGENIPLQPWLTTLLVKGQMFYYINQPRNIFIVLLIHIVAASGFIGPQKIMFTLDTKPPNPSVIYLIGHLAISQFEFLVITKKNIFTCRLFLSLNISDFNLLCDNCTP